MSKYFYLYLKPHTNEYSNGIDNKPHNASTKQS